MKEFEPLNVTQQTIKHELNVSVISLLLEPVIFYSGCKKIDHYLSTMLRLFLYFRMLLLILINWDLALA